MSYAVHEIELSQEWSVPRLATGDDGVAVIVRRQTRPIAFLMWSRPEAEAVLKSRRQFEDAISRNAARLLVSGSIAKELELRLPQQAGQSVGQAGDKQSESTRSLTIAICTRNRADKLNRLLESLREMLRQQESFAGHLEILVVDNCPSDDTTRQLVEQQSRQGFDSNLPAIEDLDRLRYVCEARPGLDFARNRAIEEAKGDWIAYLDDDVVVDPGYLASLRNVWHSQPDARAVTGLVLPLTLSTSAQVLFEQRGGFRRGFESIRYQGPNHPDNPLFPCGAGIFGAGANMAFELSLLRRLGGFDEALDTGPPLPGGGDLDMFYRTIRSGSVMVYEPAVAVYHEHREDIRGLRRQFYTWSQGFMAFMEKSWKADPPMRRKLAALYLWWWCDMLRRVAKAAVGRGPLPLSMLLTEAWGGVVGMAWQYRRSQKRVAAIQRKARRTRDKRDLDDAKVVTCDAS